MAREPNAACNFWISAGLFLSDYWLSIGMILVPIFLTGVAFVLSDEGTTAMGLRESTAVYVQWWALRLGGILLLLHLILSLFHIRHERRISALETQLAAASDTRGLVISNAKALCDGYLQDLARGPLLFGTRDKNSERITLYVHDSLSEFQPIGRFSFNQSYIKQGRSKYPDGEGCIGKAWEDGWEFRMLPEAQADLEGWVSECFRLGVPKGTSRNLNMKFALYCACTVQTSDSKTPVAVVVVESTDPVRYTCDELKKVLSEDRRNYIARLVNMLRPWIGDQADAKQRGY